MYASTPVKHRPLMTPNPSAKQSAIFIKFSAPSQTAVQSTLDECRKGVEKGEWVSWLSNGLRGPINSSGGRGEEC
ncbi:hypothetical protein BM221_010130 [Beauveria bassiana]|uniref:Uncharacterized protein n=1 Tax=Beauveria bassiana TaxID=176275 RepID=A0A2N6N9M5_BEABA|nr:hypothetical protein BM221_010130 [Beauveria bassiana]